MPINNFEGDTFVAFLDISGFKTLIEEDPKNAVEALKSFYQIGYETLPGPGNIEGIFVSDSAILFVRGNSDDDILSLTDLMGVIRTINKEMLKKDFMLSTAIAFGKFGFQNRIEFVGIEKNLLYGNAYISGFLDNENGKPPIQPGQCRIVKENLPLEVLMRLDLSDNNNLVLSLTTTRDGDEGHYYFYWMVDSDNEIERFEKRYTSTYRLKYSGMLEALKGDRI